MQENLEDPQVINFGWITCTQPLETGRETVVAVLSVAVALAANAALTTAEDLAEQTASDGWRVRPVMSELEKDLARPDREANSKVARD